ncbi:MAG: acyl-CoA dehydrogenase family protein [Actinobacteria bacterium]|nr:acyl-CoA dehydrogenase family protein [Actinomycetota bacterium]
MTVDDDARLTDDQRALVKVLRRFADDVVAPAAADHERDERFPRELYRQLGTMDLLGLPFPSGAGGGEQPFGTYLLVVEELARVYAALALAVSVNTLVATAIAGNTRVEQRDRLLPPLLSGEGLGAYCLSEPDSGSDAASLRCRAERTDAGWRLTGTKAWVTHGGVASHYLVFARSGGEGAGGISAFVVDADVDGLSVARTEDKMGLRSSPTAQIALDGVEVPSEALLGQEGGGFRIALSALDGGRLGIAALATGLARGALDAATAYAREREQFGRRIIDFQGLSFLLADMATRIAAGRALYRDAAARKDAGLDPSLAASMSKLFCTDTAMSVTTDAVQVHGGVGYTREFPVERYMREAKVLQIFEGTNQIQRLVIGRHLARG